MPGIGFPCKMGIGSEFVENPNPGNWTLTLALPTSGTSEERIVAFNCVELTNSVTRGFPFHLTTAPLMRLTPVTVSVKSGLPTIAGFGLRLEIDGGMVILKVAWLDVPPCGPGVTTVTLIARGSRHPSMRAVWKVGYSSERSHAFVAIKADLGSARIIRSVDEQFDGRAYTCRLGEEGANGRRWRTRRNREELRLTRATPRGWIDDSDISGARDCQQDGRYSCT